MSSPGDGSEWVPAGLGAGSMVAWLTWLWARARREGSGDQRMNALEARVSAIETRQTEQEHAIGSIEKACARIEAQVGLFIAVGEERKQAADRTLDRINRTLERLEQRDK